MKNQPPSLPPHLKSEATFQGMIPRKKIRKLDIVINTCVSIIKQRQKKMVEILQEHHFFICSIQNFARKVKQFHRKHYIT